MEQIDQLRDMRDAAKARIEATPDFKLMHSLTALIDDLEEALGLTQSADGAEAGEDAGEDGAAADAEEPQSSPDEDAGDDGDGLRLSVTSGGVEQAEEAYAAAVNGEAEETATAEFEAMEDAEPAADGADDQPGEVGAEEAALESALNNFESETAQVAAELESALQDGADFETVTGETGDANNAARQTEELMEHIAAAEVVAGSDENAEADAISKAMEELDADLANTKFNV